MGPSSRLSSHDAAISVDRSENGSHVANHVRNATALLTVRATVSGPREGHDPQAALMGCSFEYPDWRGRTGCPVMEHEWKPGLRSADPHVEQSPIRHANVAEDVHSSHCYILQASISECLSAQLRRPRLVPRSSRLLLVLDEIDKLSGGWYRHRGSSTAWTLELLGSATWTDRYVGVPYPTAAMSFLATANSLDPIPAPLLDRCEVAGLTVAERLEVAHSHRWPRLLDAYGLARRVVPLSAEALDLVVTGYAAPGEAGPRAVETLVESLLHRAIAQGAPARRVWITPEFVAKRLG